MMTRLRLEQIIIFSALLAIAPGGLQAVEGSDEEACDSSASGSRCPSAQSASHSSGTSSAELPIPNPLLKSSVSSSSSNCPASPVSLGVPVAQSSTASGARYKDYPDQPPACSSTGGSIEQQANATGLSADEIAMLAPFLKQEQPYAQQNRELLIEGEATLIQLALLAAMRVYRSHGQAGNYEIFLDVNPPNVDYTIGDSQRFVAKGSRKHLRGFKDDDDSDDDEPSEKRQRLSSWPQASSSSVPTGAELMLASSSGPITSSSSSSSADSDPLGTLEGEMKKELIQFPRH